MASLPLEEKVEFLIQLLVTGEFTPNYSALAEKMGINTSSNAQRRLKGIVEADKRFVLKSSGGTASIKESSGSGDSGDGKVESGTPKRTPASTKGRKRNKPITDDDDDEHNETPSKVSKKTRRDESEMASEDGIDDDLEGLYQNDDDI